MGRALLIFFLSAGALAATASSGVKVQQLPGIRVALTKPQRQAGAVEVRRVLVTGKGARRVTLLVGRTAKGGLCVGSIAFFRCLAAADAQPAYVIGAFSGRAGQGSPSWGAVVGLAGPRIARVAVELQLGVHRMVPLRRLPRFPWRAFAFSPVGPNGRLPYRVELRAVHGTLPVSVDMAWALSKCSAQGPCVRRAWRVIGDSEDAPVGETSPPLVRAKHLALADPRVRKILGSAARVVAAPSPWSSCGGTPIGAYVSFQLFRPVQVSGRLPFVAFGKEKRGRAYAEGIARVRLRGVTRVHVAVDLARDRVVSIDPTGDYVRFFGRKVVKAPRPAGGIDRTNCPPSG